VAPSRRPKGGTTRYRRNWDTLSHEILWSRASKTVSHEGADLELDSLPIGSQWREVLMKKEIWENFEMPPMRRAAGLRTD